MTIHIHKSGDIGRDTKTLCGIKLEDLPRDSGAVSFKNRQSCDCIKCGIVADRTAQMQAKNGMMFK